MNKWTASERAILRRLWPRASKEEVAAALPGRGLRSIRNRASEMGLQTARRGLGLSWTPAEDNLLRRLWATAPEAKLASALPGRSMRGLNRHARELGLQRKRHPRGTPQAAAEAVWKIVPGRTIHASDRGQVRSARTGCLLAIKWGRGSRMGRIRYEIDGVQRSCSAAQLILEAFQPEGNGRPAYRDGDVHNLALANLYWGPGKPAARPASALARPAPRTSTRDDVFAAVEKATPRYHEPDVRADIIQDVVVAVLAGDVSLDALAPAIRKATTRHHAAAGTYKTLSLDAEVAETFVDRLEADVERF